jgi:hypothetical protein
MIYVVATFTLFLMTCIAMHYLHLHYEVINVIFTVLFKFDVDSNCYLNSFV